MHEAKFRWALEAIRGGADPALAAEVLASADALDAELDHRLHHRRPHPNGGTWPYVLPLCDCEQFDRTSATSEDGTASD